MPPRTTTRVSNVSTRTEKRAEYEVQRDVEAIPIVVKYVDPKIEISFEAYAFEFTISEAETLRTELGKVMRKAAR